jgi:hypothetical protein
MIDNLLKVFDSHFIITSATLQVNRSSLAKEEVDSNHYTPQLYS